MKKVLLHYSASHLAPQRFPMKTGDENNRRGVANQYFSPLHPQSFYSIVIMLQATTTRSHLTDDCKHYIFTTRNWNLLQTIHCGGMPTEKVTMLTETMRQVFANNTLPTYTWPRKIANSTEENARKILLIETGM
jgi:hypothetical protein